MPRTTRVAIASLIAVLAFSPKTQAEEPKTLLGRIAEWQYPDSKIHGASMSDGATLNSKGERTVPSIQCKTVMTTADPIATVVEYYKSKLEPGAPPGSAKPNDKPVADSARSVTFHDDSENRPLAIHIIIVNTDKTSTTLVISRAKEESETHIAWTQYAKF